MSDEVVMDFTNFANQVVKSNKVTDAIAAALDGKTKNNSFQADEKSYREKSKKAAMELLKFQNATQLASKDLIWTGINLKNVTRMTIWEEETIFLMIRSQLEQLLTEEGIAFLGYVLTNDFPRPFVSKIIGLILDPLTQDPLKLDYLIGNVTLNGEEYSLAESYQWNSKISKFEVKRYFLDSQNKKSKIKIPDEYKLSPEESLAQEIAGEIIFNNFEHTSDVANTIHLMEDKGSFLYFLTEKSRYLLPKILDKGISGDTEDEINRKLKSDTYIKLTGKASQFQSPLVVFDPSLPNMTIWDTINKLDEQFFVYSRASKPTDTGKQAQTNDLEQSLKNELVHNWTEFKQHLRQIQLTKYFKKLGKNIPEIDQEDFANLKIEIELNSLQKKIITDPNNQDNQTNLTSEVTNE